MAEAKEFDLRRTQDALDAAQTELGMLKDQAGRLQTDNISA